MLVAVAYGPSDIDSMDLYVGKVIEVEEDVITVEFTKQCKDEDGTCLFPDGPKNDIQMTEPIFVIEADFTIETFVKCIGRRNYVEVFSVTQWAELKQHYKSYCKCFFYRRL